MTRIYDALQKAELERQAQIQSGVPVAIDQVITDSMVLRESAPRIVQAPPEKIESEETINRLSWNLNKGKLPALQATSVGSEVFRRLRSRLLELRDEKDFKSLLITSGLPGEGKTFVATNIALTLAGRDNSRVLLIDGDLRKPAAHAVLGAPPKPGFAEYLAGKAKIEEVLQSGPIPNFSFIPGGDGAGCEGELTANQKTEEIVARMAREFEWIIVDSSPVIPVSDPISLARACDAVLLVARAVSTPYPITQKAKQELSGSRILGIVLNGTEESSSSYYGHYYRYSASEHGSPAETKAS